MFIKDHKLDRYSLPSLRPFPLAVKCGKFIWIHSWNNKLLKKNYTSFVLKKNINRGNFIRDQAMSFLLIKAMRPQILNVLLSEKHVLTSPNKPYFEGFSSHQPFQIFFSIWCAKYFFPPAMHTIFSTYCAQPKHFTLGSNLIDKTLCSFYSQFSFTYGPPKKSDGRKWFPSRIFWVIDVVSVCVCFQNSQFWSIWPKTLFLTRTCPSSMIQ